MRLFRPEGATLLALLPWGRLLVGEGDRWLRAHSLLAAVMGEALPLQVPPAVSQACSEWAKGEGRKDLKQM